MNLNVRVSGALKSHVSHEVQEGAYENVSEYVRDLICRDKLKSEQLAFETLKTELQMAFSAPDSEYVELSAFDIKNR